MIKALLNRLKGSRPLKEFYADWINTLKSTLLPLLSNSLSSSSLDPVILATQIELLHTHFNSYFSALDAASNDDVSQLLFPDWRSPLQKPFLWFGDFHPYVFTNLLRSFLEDSDDDDDVCDDDGGGFLGKPSNAWKCRDNSLGHFVDQVECGLRLMVPSIVARARDAQADLVHKLGAGWKEKGVNSEVEVEVDEMVQHLVDEMSRVFLDANRLRKSVLADIMGALNVYQAAYFLHHLALFYVGFSHPKLLPHF